MWNLYIATQILYCRDCMKRISIISLVVLVVYSVLIYAFVMPEASHNTPFEFSYTLESPGVYKQTCTFNHTNAFEITAHDLFWNKNNPDYKPKVLKVALSQEETEQLKASIFESLQLEDLKPHYGFDGKATSDFVHSFSLITATDTVFLSVKDQIDNDIPKEIYSLVHVMRGLLEKHSNN